MRTLIFTMIIYSTFLSCSSERENFNEAFNETQIKVLLDMVEYYDSFIVSKVGRAEDIGDLYVEFLETTGSEAIDSGNLSLLYPEDIHQQEFFDTANPGAVVTIYKTIDSLALRFGFEYVYYPQITDSYYDFLDLLSEDIPLYKDYTDNLINGSMSALSISGVLDDPSIINFNNFEERLLFVVNVLFIAR